MNTKEVEEILGRPFNPEKSLSEQCTPEQWAEICFWSEVEIEIETEASRPGIIDREKIEKKVRGKWQKTLNDAQGNFQKALNQL